MEQGSQKQYNDRDARDQQALLPGQAVEFQTTQLEDGLPAALTEKCPESWPYIDETQAEGVLRMNTWHIR